MNIASTDRIQLSVPAVTSAVRIARAGAAGLATRAGFTYQEVEQVQLAVAEAAAALASAGGDEPSAGEPVPGTLTVVFELAPDVLAIELVLSGGAAPADVTDMAVAVLDAAVDRWRASPDGRRIVLRKNRVDPDIDDD